MIFQRLETIETREKITVKTPEDLVPLLTEFYKQNNDREIFTAIALDGSQNVISVRIVAVGTVTNCKVHCRDIFRFAILENAAAIIVSHNHPSGNIEPSSDDIMTTEKVKQAAEIIGIQVLDHIIIGGGDFYSFKANETIF